MDTLLIANRGEIACRITRTARTMGIETIAVYTDPDRRARHVGLADRAVRIESYLSIEALIEAAQKTGAEAIHPGYGFLAENAAFAKDCLGMGILFVGPPVEAIDLMGSKRRSKEKMIAAGVPCVPGYTGASQDEATLVKEAEKLGVPLMIKASAGGGGKGLRLVEAPGKIADQIRLARSEAESAFGDGELILERAILEPRHVEIQVFADTHGNVIHLGERDCSVQRRHQKVIEESPSPAVNEEIRRAMGDAAVEAARSIGYVGAGTVEFLLGNDGHFYFMEMNTRLQVEHPVTEMVTGLDLVAWQLDVASGGELPLSQEDVRFSGHAIEVRLYAEDPSAGYLPQTGHIERLVWPADARVDHGLEEGTDVTAHYDPMLAKVIVHGRNRDEARRKLIRALKETAVHGVVTNQRFLIDVLAHPAFAGDRVTTGFLGEHFPNIERAEADPRATALAAVLISSRDQTAFWRSTGPAPFPVRLRRGEETMEVWVLAHDASTFEVDGIRVELLGGDRVCVDGVDRTVLFSASPERVHVTMDGHTETFERAPASKAAEGGGDDKVVAPMAGKVVEVLAKAGDPVTRGQILVILEAMKMQLELTAQIDGTIDDMTAEAGLQVDMRQVLATIVPAS